MPGIDLFSLTLVFIVVCVILSWVHQVRHKRHVNRMKQSIRDIQRMAEDIKNRRK